MIIKSIRAAVILAALLSSLSTQSAEPTHTRLDAIAIWDDRPIDPAKIAETIKNVGVFQHVTNPAIIAYLPPKEKANGTSLLICPGGGYSGLAWLHHVERLAPFFAERGIAVIGLKYRTNYAENKIPEDPVADFNQAIKVVRQHAKEWNLDPKKIVGTGFSAGANLLLQYACTPGGETIDHLNFLCLWPYFREPATYKIQKKDLNTILFTTGEDKIAPAAFSIAMTDILKLSDCDATLKMYEKGTHMAFNWEVNGSRVDWAQDFLKWLESEGLIE
ncbi:alpha/beta hydrolase [Rubritalea marina]|uniref:alpha/beta hydrolase n=1 Tax=Rubritalea marina TaxID=361055 RepID=UPI0003637A50|nr:alpha/beta hydrolase [Rubritalea marina]